MGKLADKPHKFLMNLPESHYVRMVELMKDRFDSMASYLRYLIRQEIQRYGPLPNATKPSRRRAPAPEPASAPADTPLHTPDQPDEPVSSSPHQS